MRHEVHISDPELVDDLLAALSVAQVRAERKDRKTVLVASPTNGDDTRIELAFFLRAWAISHPGVRIDVAEMR
jgi:hypothetical protein